MAAGKGDRDRSDNAKYRENFPLKEAFEPQWKKDLREKRKELAQ